MCLKNKENRDKNNIIHTFGSKSFQRRSAEEVYLSKMFTIHILKFNLGQYQNILEPCFLTLYLFLSFVNAFYLLLFDFVLLSYCITHLQYLIIICFLFVLSNGRKRRQVIALVELNYLTSPMCKLMGKQ